MAIIVGAGQLLGTANQELAVNAGATDVAYVTATGSAGTAAPFGDGSDGTVTLGSDTTLTRDQFYGTLTTGAFQLLPAGFRVFCSGTLTVSASGAIRRNGNAGAGSVTGGAALSVQSLGGAAAGASGVSGAGGNQTSSLGGNGGSAPLGGAGGTASAAANLGGIRFNVGFLTGYFFGNSAVSSVNGGAGGGAGSSGSSGGGGGGGGVLVISTKTLVLTGNITVTGGAGGNSGGEGGGGGGGGVIFITYSSTSGAGTITAGGGAGGTGNTPGNAGSAGTVIQVQTT